MFYQSDCFLDPGSPEGLSSGSRARQRLKPWLEAQINSGRFPGLTWVDKHSGIFRITWKHGGRADWSEQDALIFKEWAIHTGRYREGTDNPDWPSWKTRLRCALNKLPDIQELKDRSCYDEPNPYRVYKFVDRRGSTSPPAHHTPASSVSEDSCGFSTPPPAYRQPQRRSVIQPNIPTTVKESLDSTAAGQRQEDTHVSSLGSDLAEVSITDLLPINHETPISLTNISVDSNIHTEPMDTDSLKGGAYHHHLSQHIKPEPLDRVDPPVQYHHNPMRDHEFNLTIRYRRQLIKQQNVTNPHGCRLYYGDISKYMAMWDPQLLGDSRADQVMVPYQPGQLESRQDQLTYTLLHALELGFNIYMHKGAIYLLRHCKTTIFTCPPNRPDQHTFKVERRNQPVKIFDYNNDFLPAFLKYQAGQGPRPSPHVIVAIGQNFHHDQVSGSDPYVNLLLSVTLAHPSACQLMAQHVPEGPPVEISRSNEFDRSYSSYMHAAHGASSAALPVTQALTAYTSNTQ